MSDDLIEPSDLEQSEWPQATEAYVRGLEARIEDLESMLTKDVEFVLLPQMAAVTKKLKVMEAKLAKAVDGLRQSRDEIDGYIRQEYPHDHPVQERCRQRDFAANPARTTLAELVGNKDE